MEVWNYMWLAQERLMVILIITMTMRLIAFKRPWANCNENPIKVSMELDLWLLTLTSLQWTGEPTASYIWFMNWLSLRNNRLKFKTSRKLPWIIPQKSLEESIEYTSKIFKKIQKITTCNWLDLETIGSRLIMPKISLDIASLASKGPI